MELAGEIDVDFPDKKVILVHRGPKLLRVYWFSGFPNCIRLVDVKES